MLQSWSLCNTFGFRGRTYRNYDEKPLGVEFLEGSASENDGRGSYVTAVGTSGPEALIRFSEVPEHTDVQYDRL